MQLREGDFKGRNRKTDNLTVHEADSLSSHFLR